jgi:dTDP-4-amino-4,6-dideoxygalactose transaminase
MREIPFHRPSIGEEEIRSVSESLRAGWLTMGPKTVQFEQAFAEYLGVPHAVSVSSCTAALHLALACIGLQEGDEVLIPDSTFAATAEVVTYFKARPVVVDVGADDLLMDPEKTERAVTARTRALIPVHHSGQSCDMDALMDLARRRNLHVVEDAAHALPSTYRGRKIGALGPLTCFSFYATKTLATGEGGMVTTFDETLAARIRVLRLHGIDRDAWKRYTKEGSWYYEVVEAGYKYNLTDPQAALGLVQLRRLEAMLEARRRIADAYRGAFSSMEGIRPLRVHEERGHAWHLFVILLDPERLTISREAFIRAMAERGIGTSVHFIPLHRQPYYRDTFGLSASDFPACEWAYQRQVSLPIYPDMTADDTAYVIESVRELLALHRR